MSQTIMYMLAYDIILQVFNLLLTPSVELHLNLCFPFWSQSIQHGLPFIIIVRSHTYFSNQLPLLESEFMKFYLLILLNAIKKPFTGQGITIHSCRLLLSA